MKQKIFFALFFLALCLVSAEDFKGFMGIPFGSSKAECMIAMEKKGWSFETTGNFFETADALVFSPKNGRLFANKKADPIILIFAKDKLFFILIDFKEENAGQEVLEAYTKKI